MRGKVKYCYRDVWYKENQADHWSSDNHPVRVTDVYAVLYDGTEVEIDEDDVRDYYDRERITEGLISQLSNDLHNEWIEYYEDEDGDLWLDGDLEDYLDDD